MTMQTPNIKPGLDSFGDWFSETFRIWSTHWQIWTLQGLIVLALTVVPALILGPISGVLVGQRYGSEPGILTGIYATFYGWYLLLPIAFALVGPGMVITALKQLRGQQSSVGDIFSGVGFFWGSLLITICIALGVLGCGIGLYITQAFLFLALPYMVDRKTSASAAISFSWTTCSSHFGLFLLFAFVISLIAWMGMSACCIGYIFSLSFFPIAQAVAYERSFSATSAGTAASAPPYNLVPPPPYVPRVEDPTDHPEA